ncbi:hypothetical protein [uncultured Allomuricauda sp.]|nr:hypothetical protein [uncultured Allomuricauda sp.]
MMPNGEVSFQLPLVKSGNGCGAPPLATERSLKGATAHRVSEIAP